ncbi:hypothetical protein FKM82_018092 [Ascaphus truei]
MNRLRTRAAVKIPERSVGIGSGDISSTLCSQTTTRSIQYIQLQCLRGELPTFLMNPLILASCECIDDFTLPHLNYCTMQSHS